MRLFVYISPPIATRPLSSDSSRSAIHPSHRKSFVQHPLSIPKSFTAHNRYFLLQTSFFILLQIRSIHFHTLQAQFAFSAFFVSEISRSYQVCPSLKVTHPHSFAISAADFVQPSTFSTRSLTCWSKPSEPIRPRVESRTVYLTLRATAPHVLLSLLYYYSCIII